MDESREVQTLIELEGFNVEEAVLSYAARKKLPKSAFCGPDRSYPAHDAAHVRNAFTRLAQFGRKLPESVRKRIHSCLMRKAKKFGVEHGGCWICKKKKSKTEETKSVVDWYLETMGICDGCNK